MSAPLSAADQRAELNWLKYREQADYCRGLKEENKKQWDAGWDLRFAIEHALQADMSTSVQALASVLIIQIEDDEPREDVTGLRRASLAALRPQLVGSIAEAADRVLVKKHRGARTITPQAKPDPAARAEKAFFGVEGEIHNVSHMAQIAWGLLMEVGVTQSSGTESKIDILPWEFEQIQFAVSHTVSLASGLVAAFQKKFEGEERA
jgi:hypothetical protein